MQEMRSKRKFRNTPGRPSYNSTKKPRFASASAARHPTGPAPIMTAFLETEAESVAFMKHKALALDKTVKVSESSK